MPGSIWSISPPASSASVDALVLAPGIPHTHPEPHPVAADAKARDLSIIGDVELLLRALPDRRGRRHHRHQRQIDHHGADRPHTRTGPAAGCRSAAISVARRWNSRTRAATAFCVLELSLLPA
ncbi:MAG: hypothetical protein ACMVO3_22110 [Thalassobaculum sp.]